MSSWREGKGGAKEGRVMLRSKLTFFLLFFSLMVWFWVFSWVWCRWWCCLVSVGVVYPGGKKVATKAKRWYKEVGLGFKTPAEAITGTYIGTSTISATGKGGNYAHAMNRGEARSVGRVELIISFLPPFLSSLSPSSMLPPVTPPLNSTNKRTVYHSSTILPSSSTNSRTAWSTLSPTNHLPRNLLPLPPPSPSPHTDKKCPFTGDVSIRGRILTGKVVSAGKMTRTIIIRRDYLVRSVSH